MNYNARITLRSIIYYKNSLKSYFFFLEINFIIRLEIFALIEILFKLKMELFFIILLNKSFILIQKIHKY